MLRLETSEIELVLRHNKSRALRQLHFIYPPTVPEYFEELVPKFLEIP